MYAYSIPNAINQGLFIRNRAKKLQEQVNSFLTDCNFYTFENVILPKCSTLIILRNIFEERKRHCY